MTILIANINNLTNDFEVREMNEIESEELNLTRIKYAEEKQKRLDEASTKALAKIELLDRLGITEDEVKLLLS